MYYNHLSRLITIWPTSITMIIVKKSSALYTMACRQLPRDCQQKCKLQLTPSPSVSEFSRPLEPLWSRLSVSRAFDRFTFCLDIIFGVGRGRDGIAAGSLTSRGRFPLFCNLSQCVSQQSILSDFICDGSSSLQSESGLDLLARWSDGFSAMSVHGIRP